MTISDVQKYKNIFPSRKIVTASGIEVRTMGKI